MRFQEVQERRKQGAGAMIGVAMLQTSYKADSASAPTVSGHSPRKILPFRHWRLVISEELAHRGWQESELATRRRSDRRRLASAARLRSETNLRFAPFQGFWREIPPIIALARTGWLADILAA